jgi:hypothetical protein
VSLCTCFLHAGIMGYAWVAVLHYWLQLSYTVTLLSATIMPGIWLAVFHSLMRISQPHSSKGLAQYCAVATSAEGQPDRNHSPWYHIAYASGYRSLCGCRPNAPPGAACGLCHVLFTW